MKAPIRSYLLTVAAVLPLTACAQCAPGKVGQGVSRLTIRNVGAIATLALADSRCGFQSAQVLGSPLIEGDLGRQGAVTWTVEGCELSFPDDAPYVSEDCNGVQTLVRGTVVVTAKQTVQGILTGIEDTPVIPAGPDAATLEIIDAQVTNFSAESSASPNVLTMLDGSVQAIMRPRLGVDDDKGACSIPTKNVRFEQVRYTPSTVHVKTDSRSFEVPVESAELYAVNGQYMDFENELWGQITVWGSLQDVEGGEDGLDPDYERDAFHQSYACAAGLAQPVTFQCDGFLGPVLAQNAARLSVRVLGRVATVLDNDKNCGFSSPAVQASGQLMGEVGGQGSATLRAESCVIELPDNSVIREDCHGTQTLGSGRIIVSGTKTITGRLTGDLATPAVPMTDAPAEISIQVEAFDDFTVMEAGAGLRMKNGKMSGRLVPRTVQDASLSGACAFVTSIARLSDISWDTDSDIQIISDTAGTFDVRLGDTRLQALSGTWGSDENQLDGYIELDGERYDLPADPRDDGLDPSYERAAFDSTWQCGSLVMPPSYACEFTAPLAQGASQLTIQMAGAIAKLLDGNTECGFSNPGVMRSVAIDGEHGRRGAVGTYTVNQPCRMDFGAGVAISEDCTGKKTYASGVVEITGSKVLSGIASGDWENPIVPTSQDPAVIRFSARAEDFAVWTDPSTKILTAKTGRLSGTLAPRTGIDVTTGACSISTPIAAITEVTWQDANLSLDKDGLQFDMRVARSDLTAQNGNSDANTNYLAGTVVLDGESWNIPVDGNPVLDPDYDQAAFNASYACTDLLEMPTDPTQCDMYQVLGENLGRLVALSAGSIASVINGDDSCGFEDFWVKTDPTRVEGDTGDIGLIEWEIDGCNLGRSGGAAQQPVSIDCLGRERFWEGSMRVDAKRTVVGRRESEYWIFDSIVPSDPTSVTIELQQVGLTGFELWEDESGMPSPLRGVRIDGGLLSGSVAPVTGERADDHGVFDVTTPVAHMTNLRLVGAPVTIRSGAMSFNLFVNETNVEAFNGSYQEMGMRNLLAGHVVIDDVRVDFGGDLDPAYTQSDFDARYVCDGNLRNPIPN